MASGALRCYDRSSGDFLEYWRDAGLLGMAFAAQRIFV
jgi:hypothetical protein